MELIAGKTRANGVAALLNNWEKLDEVFQSASDSEGSALKENEAVINSIEGKIKIFKASLEELVQDIVSSDLIKFIIDAGTKAIQFLDTGIGKVTALSAAIGLIAKLKGGGRRKNVCLE